MTDDEARDTGLAVFTQEHLERKYHYAPSFSSGYRAGWKAALAHERGKSAQQASDESGNDGSDNAPGCQGPSR